MTSNFKINHIFMEAIQDIFIIFNDSDTNILYNVTDLKYDYYFSFFDKVNTTDIIITTKYAKVSAVPANSTLMTCTKNCLV
ncbi:hypothetical protein RIR_jg13728.t1 [Rhizophagus irregularis DAOM 181602=DAOM 197198]|nr:hypothetical protein RIR_jg13728.t1 [Rhizophagus irregularis DAOM 181602=DAOM 197198]